MEPAPSATVFSQAPAGRFLSGPGWVSFCHSPALWGFALAGVPSAASVEALVAALSIELQPGVARHASLVDAQRLVGVEPAAFAAFERYVATHAARLAERVSHLAVVCAPGLSGAAVAGFFGVMPAPFPVSVVSDLESGLRVLHLTAPRLASDLARALASEQAPLDTAAQVRAVLRGDPRATPAEVAHALCTTPRTLQRRLAAAGTSLRAEQSAARLELALRRIAETDESLTAIALACGYASVQHLGRDVRAAQGCSPSAWRVARTDHRSAPP
jgi:AraC-like DNA-binding protein